MPKRYEKIKSIDGQHPFKQAAPGAYVEYQVRRRSRGRIRFFNFPLAKEMGLIPASEEHELNPELNEVLLDTFGLIIINEYDLAQGARFKAGDIKPHRYMATRYLQLQHPDKKGLQSGDGRSIWNGYVQHRGKTWDISSCGTGATRLSPATALNQVFFRTGDPTISYGCGYSTLSEGLIDVLFSEILNRNNIPTERVLCVIEFPGGYSVTVRAGLNLLRPSHFFNHLKQANLPGLKNVTDYYIDRQVGNGVWQAAARNRYDEFLKRMTETFATISANFEAQYIFCWLDWDGDNILADGGIIDFGSVRQFGLYFHEYRFDDDERWSTTIKEQKQKARYTLQCFAQAVDFIKTGHKKTVQEFKNHPCLKEFQQIFEQRKRDLLLWRIGLKPKDRQLLMRYYVRKIEKFEKLFYSLEQRKSSIGPQTVPDGINWPVLFSMRRLLAILPQNIRSQQDLLKPDELLQMIRSSHVPPSAASMTPYLRRQLTVIQKLYYELLRSLAKRRRLSLTQVLSEIEPRSQLINRDDRITGDSICLIGEKLVRLSHELDTQKFHALLENFARQQILNPDYHPSKYEFTLDLPDRIEKFLNELGQLVYEYREGI
ncbi:MAG: protein adenylyltransferase SelO family protein [Oligoflexus sp.]